MQDNYIMKYVPYCMILYGDSRIDPGMIIPADLAAFNFQMTYGSKGYPTGVNLVNFNAI